MLVDLCAQLRKLLGLLARRRLARAELVLRLAELRLRVGELLLQLCRLRARGVAQLIRALCRKVISGTSW